MPALKDDDSLPHRQRLRSLAGCRSGRAFLRAAALGRPLRQEPGTPRASILASNPPGVVIGQLQLDEDATPAGAIAPLLADLQSRLQAIPGVQSQGMAKIVPLALMGREETRMRLDTDPLDQRGPMVLVNRVSPGWFSTVQIPLLAGRDFTETTGRALPVWSSSTRQQRGSSGMGTRSADAWTVEKWLAWCATASTGRLANRSGRSFTRPTCNVQSGTSSYSCERLTPRARRRPCAPRWPGSTRPLSSMSGR